MGWEGISSRIKQLLAFTCEGLLHPGRQQDMKHVLLPTWCFSHRYPTFFPEQGFCVCVLLSQVGSVFKVILVSSVFKVILTYCQTVSSIVCLDSSVTYLVSPGRCYQNIFLFIIVLVLWEVRAQRKVTSVCANVGTSYWCCVVGEAVSRGFPVFKANPSHAVPQPSFYPLACLSAGLRRTYQQWKHKNYFSLICLKAWSWRDFSSGWSYWACAF